MSADAAHPDPRLAARLQRIYTLHRTDIDLRLGTSPYNDLLARLGNPQRKLPPVVHVAGTNGKGSVLAMLRAMLEAAGYTTHVYTSPHLVTFNERIRVAGNIITDAALMDLYDRVERINAGAPVTFFEFTTAMAFLAFSETPADVVLLETGLGGRLDCTNVVDAPVCTAITKISYDHTEFLGTTLPQIAAEKAGIMKANVPCVIGPQMDAAAVMPVFENAAKKLNAPLLVVGKNVADGLPELYPPPSLLGAHQIENAATALAVIDVLQGHGFTIPDAARRQGLAHIDWPARLQRIIHGALAQTLPAGWELWFDAAHNDSGARALAAQLRAWRTQDPANQGHLPIHLIVGLAADKDARAYFAALAGTYDSLTLIDLPFARKPQMAQNILARLPDLHATTAKNIEQAIEIKKEDTKNKGSKLVVAGSLYLFKTLTGPA